MKKPQKIIGGKFGLPTELLNNALIPVFLERDPILMFNGRSCIKLVVDGLKPGTVWLPSYLCPTILTAINQNFSKIKFYPINTNLAFSSLDFLSEIKPGDLYFYIDYFGFPFTAGFIDALRAKSVYTFHDCSQALFFDPQKSPADFCLYCPRKFLGVPDGGILHVIESIRMEIPELRQPPNEILISMLSAIIQRREFDLYGGDRDWNNLFHRAEDDFSPVYAKMSDVSLLLLTHAFDYQEIIQQRRRNYACLLEKLEDFALYRHLPESVVPLGFPIAIQKRDNMQQALFQKEIYPAIHWDINEAVPAEFITSHQLSNEILTLPCDQRYDEEDMIYLANNVVRAMY